MFSRRSTEKRGMKRIIFCAVAIYFLTSCSSVVESTTSITAAMPIARAEIDAKAKRQIAFVSKKASEATLTYSWFVEMESAGKPTVAEAKEQVAEQVQHMFGPMERSDVMAAPKEDHKITVKASGIEQIEEGRWRIAYDYEGTIVLENGPRTKYRFLLPVNPDKIYQAAMVGRKNPCTDEHYQDEGDFWYFWSPAGWGKDEFPNCKLRSNQNGRVEDGEDYELVSASVERLPKDRTTYPEYDRLAEKNVIDVHLFYGMDEAEGVVDPYKSRDINADIYKGVARGLKANGFELRKWSEDEIHSVVPQASLESPVFVEEAVKDYSSGLKLRVRLFFGQTGIDEEAAGFHYFFRDALKSSSVMIYNGHSGLGGHLDLQAIADLHGFRIAPNKNRYQIYFFNSCTSYTYYNTTYFNRKRAKGKKSVDTTGTKNLDIMANGLATAFEGMDEVDLALVNAIDKFAQRKTWTSFQRIARDVDTDNLFTVNGDEDNPTSPRR